MWNTIRVCILGLLVTAGLARISVSGEAPGVQSGAGLRRAQSSRGAGGKLPGVGDRVLFTFVIFGDHKTGGPLMDANFAGMKRVKPSFYIGMGDHFTSLDNLAGFDAAIRKAFGATEVFYRRFYLTAGDNEAGAYAGRQNALGAERPFFHHARLFDRKDDKPLRRTIVDHDARWLDYYAQLCVGGLRLHLVNLYDQDSVDMQKETIAFGERVSEHIRKTCPGEPWVVMAHDGDWWRRSFGNGHAIYACDLLLGASWHVYVCLGRQGGGTCMAFNTSAVGRGGRSWYAVMVLRDRFVLLNIDDKTFAVKGWPGCHVKPFGRPGFDGDAAAWFEKLKSYGEGIEGDWGPEPGDPSSFGYKRLGDLAKRAAERKGLGGILERLKELLEDPDEAKAAEAKRLTAEIEGWGRDMLAEAEAAAKDDPLRAIRIYDSVRSAFAGHDLAETARRRASELRRESRGHRPQ